MKLTADRDGNVRYFSAKLGLRERFDPKEIEILSMGAIPMLIPPATVQGHKNNVIKYDISSYSTLEFYLTCILSREQFAEILLQCIDVFQRMQQIYLNYMNLVFDLDKIYIQLSDRTVHFIYLPLMSSKRKASQPDFFRSMVVKAVRSTYEQSSFLDACLSWLGRPASFGLAEFERFIRDNTGVTTSRQPNAAPALSVEPELRQPERFVCPKPVNGWVPSGSSPVQGNTCRLDEPVGGTVILGSEPSAPAVRFYILRVQTEEKIELTQFPFLVGTERGCVAYCVTGNAAVSRRHAEFSMQDGECFVTDQKSTNKTYVNDCALVPLAPQPLKDGDSIRLGNEQFQFIREEPS